MSSTNGTDFIQPQLQYNYIPTRWVGITFLSFYGITTFIHIVQAYYYRLWWLFPTTILCGWLELAGWSGRVWSSSNPYLDKPYILQAVTLIMAPTPLVAANFILLGRIIGRLGPQYSRLTPRRYTIIFVSCDLISLVVQGVGGGIASGSQTSASQTALGGHIALGGTSFQLVAIGAYVALAAEFLTRYVRDRPIQRSTPVPGDGFRGRLDKYLTRMLQAMIIMTVFLVIRTIYRVAEFVNGWNGKIISTQWLFCT
ncbi:RTA1 like protein [Russula earlei]|uniref:RTA1 like protein n=1 Tax=Russula earlei TaxID=71964 RepID=A0ACC0UDA7_9AGAM|nr:RTA1 like protein [Russula earlei]